MTDNYIPCVEVHGMADYQAFTVGKGGSYISCERLACDNDAEAFEKARRLTKTANIDLWAGERYIIRLPREVAK